VLDCPRCLMVPRSQSPSLLDEYLIGSDPSRNWSVSNEMDDLRKDKDVGTRWIAQMESTVWCNEFGYPPPAYLPGLSNPSIHIPHALSTPSQRSNHMPGLGPPPESNGASPVRT
jgi:hypothetical protein